VLVSDFYAAATQKAFSSLPDREARIAHMQSIIDHLSSTTYATPSGEFTAVQQELRTLMKSRALPKP